MATYTAIPDTDIDAESPGKTGVFTKLRDNAIALYENTRTAIYKSVQEDVVASTVLQDDDVFSLTVGASDVWVLRFHLLVTTTAANGDLKIQITTPGGGPTGYVHAIGYDAGTSVTNTGALDAAINIDYTGARTADPLLVTAYVGAATGGTVKLQWAQIAANGTTSLLAGCLMEAFRTDAL